MGAVMVSEETPASTKKHLSQAWKATGLVGLVELKTEVPPARTHGSVLRLEELLTQDLGSCTETRDAPPELDTRGSPTHRGAPA